MGSIISGLNRILSVSILTSMAVFFSVPLNADIKADSLMNPFSKPMQWKVGVEFSPAFVPGTNDFLKYDNPLGKRIDCSFATDFRGDFSFNKDSAESMLFPGLYQGLGVGVNTFFSNSLLGTPVSAYVYQGAQIVRFTSNVWLGYEWQFGAAMGWKHYNEETADRNVSVGTDVTAHIGLGIKLHYQLTKRLVLTLGVMAKHYSNGNTSWPNAGINSIGASLGVAYIINAQDNARSAPETLRENADRPRWLWDIIGYGAWRKRVVTVAETPQLCPGRFGVVGMQFAPMRKLNRWVAVGASLDVQYDESGGISPYWVEGTTEDYIKFYRPPFGKQLSVGLSAHGELTMPIFAVNVGLGYDFLNPKGNKRFYQSLTLKTFITRNIFLNVGYRLGNFKDPQNLMLGVGVRL